MSRVSTKIRLVFQASALFVSALGKPTCKGLPGNRCKTFMGGLLDPWWYFGIWWCHFRRLQQHQFRGHETWVVFGDKICQAFSGNVREASPACTHPFNSKWEAKFNALARCFGGWSAGQSRHTQPTRGWPNESSKYGHCGMQMLLGVIYSWCLSIYNHPKHNTSQRSTTSFDAYSYFVGSGWKWPVSTNLENNSWSCLSTASGLPNYQFHQIQDKFNTLGKYSFAQIPSCGLASACHQLPATAFWGKDSKHQRENPRPMGGILLGKKL